MWRLGLNLVGKIDQSEMLRRENKYKNSVVLYWLIVNTQSVSNVYWGDNRIFGIISNLLILNNYTLVKDALDDIFECYPTLFPSLKAYPFFLDFWKIAKNQICD